MQDYLDNLINLSVLYAPRVVGALLVLVVGFWIVGWLSQLLAKAMLRTQVQADLGGFLKRFVSILLKVLVGFPFPQVNLHVSNSNLKAS